MWRAPLLASLVLCATALACSPEANFTLAQPHPLTGPVTLPDVIAQVPCLDYDGVTDDPSANSDRYVVSPATYARHLDWIAAHDYTALTMKQLDDLVAHPAFPNNGFPARPVLIMSDTTSRWFTEVAAPALLSRGLTATVGLEVDLIGKSWAMSPGDLKTLQQLGFELASHTFSHPDLTKIAPHLLAREVSLSRDALTALGLDVHSFIYPYGAHDISVMAAAQIAGYSSARGTGAPTISGGGYAAIDPARRLSRGCALPTTRTSMEQLKAYMNNPRLEIEDLFVVVQDAGKLATITRAWDFTRTSYGAVYMGDAGDTVSVTFLVTRAGTYDLELRVKTGIQGQNTYTAADYRYYINGAAAAHTTSGPYDVESKWVVWGHHHLAPLKLKPGWVTLEIRGDKDWAALLDWLTVTKQL